MMDRETAADAHMRHHNYYVRKPGRRSDRHAQERYEHPHTPTITTQNTTASTSHPIIAPSYYDWSLGLRSSSACSWELQSWPSVLELTDRCAYSATFGACVPAVVQTANDAESPFKGRCTLCLLLGGGEILCLQARSSKRNNGPSVLWS